MSEWRTPTVVAICQGMREAQDYSALPILADALQDADYPDEKVLEQMRARQDATGAQRLVALVFSDETAAAVRKVEELANDMGPRAFVEEGDGYGDEKPTTYDRLMRVGDRWTEPRDEKWYWGGTVEHGAEGLRDGDFGAGFFAEFWEAYKTITGRVGEGNPFGCTC